MHELPDERPRDAIVDISRQIGQPCRLCTCTTVRERYGDISYGGFSFSCLCHAGDRVHQIYPLGGTLSLFPSMKPQNGFGDLGNVI